MTDIIIHKRFDFRVLTTTGGMPSSHSAGVVGLTTTIGIIGGWTSLEFAVSVGLSLVTMYDAAGIRRASGKMAVCLNKMMEDFYKKDINAAGTKLKEMLAIYRRNGFEAIHDAIIQYMKCVIGKKNEISIDEFIDIIGILNYTVNYLKMKIKNIDSNNQVKMHKYICPCLSYLHTFANIINTSSYKKESQLKITDIKPEIHANH